MPEDEPPIIEYASPVEPEFVEHDPTCVVSFISGVLLLFLCGFTISAPSYAQPIMAVLAVVPIITGLIGLWRSTPRYRMQAIRLRSGHRTAGFAIAGLLLGGLVLATAVMSLHPHHPRERVRRIKCGSNLRQIGQAMRQYAIFGDGGFPPDFDTLLASSDLVPETFLCPSSDTPEGVPPIVFGANCDFIYFGGGLSDNVPATVVLAIDALHHHDGEGANVLFADGSVRFLDPPAYYQALADSAAALAVGE